ncbi:NAD-P-binding protein [Rhodocollybia butyracea]|uniref:NAD-P-binding protein n=1 Tax=Rhodocollybia butyracea TaxID=206335 RepID=A0A9P5PQ27_9AGAR|nr:NAD-P-binding protein [Rhodocollybia butyracea]
MVTGGVKSNIARPRSMPENSLYKPMEDLYLKKRLNMSQENAMPTTQYAQEVAKEVLKPKSSVWFWIANLSSVAWFADRFIPQSLLTAIVAKRFGLDTFAARIASSNPPKSIASGKKSVLITGCSTGGIGHALAKEFYSRGHRVFATARRLESMSELDSLGITVLELDVTNVESIRQARDKIASIMDGKLDILVNNATMALVDEDFDAARDMFAVNVFAVISMVQEFLPLLRASGDGRVAQVESINSIFPVPFWGVYNSSKAKLHALSNTMRAELEPFKYVSSVCSSVYQGHQLDYWRGQNQYCKTIIST